MASGEWLVPRYNGELYDQKPPLIFWVSALCMKTGALLGASLDDPFWVRLPSAMGALVAALGTALLGRLLFPERQQIGLIAALMLICSWQMQWSARFLHLDAPVVACVVWTLLALLSAAASTGSRRVTWIVLGIIAAASGLMLKGPLAIVFPGLTLIAWSLASRESGFLRRSGLLWMSVAAGAMALAWFLFAWRAAGDVWAEELLLRQGILRLIDETPKQKHGVAYYPSVIWGLFAPWSPMLALGLVARWWRSSTTSERRSLLFLALWVAAVFVPLSFGATRRSRYLMPALPALALLCAQLLDQGALRGGSVFIGRGLRVLVGVMALVYLAAMTGALVLASGTWGPEVWVAVSRETGILSRLILAVMGLCVAFWTIFKLRSAAASHVLAAGLLMMTTLLAGLGLVILPAADRVRDDQAIYTQLAPLVDRGCRLAVVGGWAQRESTAGFFLYYLDAPIERVGKDGSALETLAKEGPVVALMNEEERLRSPLAIPPGWRRLNEEALGHIGLNLYLSPGVRR